MATACVALLLGSERELGSWDVFVGIPGGCSDDLIAVEYPWKGRIVVTFARRVVPLAGFVIEESPRDLGTVMTVVIPGNRTVEACNKRLENVPKTFGIYACNVGQPTDEEAVRMIPVMRRDGALGSGKTGEKEVVSIAGLALRVVSGYK